MNDSELICQVLNGNMNAFTFLVNRYQKLVLHISGRLIQRQVELEDVCQDVISEGLPKSGKVPRRMQIIDLDCNHCIQYQYQLPAEI